MRETLRLRIVPKYRIKAEPSRLEKGARASLAAATARRCGTHFCIREVASRNNRRLYKNRTSLLTQALPLKLIEVITNRSKVETNIRCFCRRHFTVDAASGSAMRIRTRALTTLGTVVVAYAP